MNSCESTRIWLRRAAVSLCLGLSIALTGCFDTKQEFTINPDGSGKVVHECRFDDEHSDWRNSAESEKSLKEAVQQLIEKSKGVEVWRDVTFSRLEDGRVYFRGTAYFRRLDNLDINQQMALYFTWATISGDTKILAQGKRKRDSENFDMYREFGSGREQLGTNPSPAAVAKYVRDQQVKYRTLRPFFEQSFGHIRHEATFNLPGTISKPSIFVPVTSNQLTVIFDGTNTLTMLDTLVNDGENFKRTLTATNSVNLRDATEEESNALKFGKHALLQATVSAGKKHLFDYNLEVQAALPDFIKLQNKLGTVAPSIAPAKEAAFKSLKIVGVRFLGPGIKAHDFGQWGPKPGLTLSLLAEFDGRVESLAEDRVVESALCDDGTSLLPATKSDCNIEIAERSANRTAYLLGINLLPPGENARVLKELTGRVQFRSEAEWRQIDLGFSELRDGAKGSEFGASIVAIRRAWQNSRDLIDLNLKLHLEKPPKVNMEINGARTALDCTAFYDRRDYCQLSLLSTLPIPKNGRLILEVPGKLQDFNLPFKLQNIPLPTLASEAVK